jgi:hypothetical protein
MLTDLIRTCLLRGARRRRPNSGPSQRRWDLLRLEDRDVPAIGFATAAGPGIAGSPVNVYDTTGALLISFSAFPGFFGGAKVATGDLNGDGSDDLVVGAGAGGTPQVKVYDGATLSLGGAAAQLAVDNPLKNFLAYSPNINSGVNVAAGDFNGDGQGDIATGPGSQPAPPGAHPFAFRAASHVKVFNFVTLAEIYSFYAYDPSLACGATVAAGNVGGDLGNPPIHDFPSDELITGSGYGGGPHVKVYAVSLTDINVLDTVGQFYAYDPGNFGGITVGSGIVTRNIDSSLPPTDPFFNVPFADIVTGSGFTAAPHVKVFRLDNGQNPDPGFQFTFLTAASFFAYDAAPLGVNVAVTPNLDGDVNNTQDFITGPNTGGGPHTRIWGGQQLADLETYSPPNLGLDKFVFAPSFTGGVFVA